MQQYTQEINVAVIIYNYYMFMYLVVLCHICKYVSQIEYDLISITQSISNQSFLNCNLILAIETIIFVVGGNNLNLSSIYSLNIVIVFILF